jgi:hypothetical protein
VRTKRTVGEDGTDRQGPRVSGREHVSEWAMTTRRTHRAERVKGKRAREGEGIGTDRVGPLSRERAVARMREGRRRHAGPRWQREIARAGKGKWAAWAERPGKGGSRASFYFSFILNFLIIFLLFSSFEFKSNQPTNTNLNISNMCINQKQSLGSV